jgi:hypothetical protein
MQYHSPIFLLLLFATSCGEAGKGTAYDEDAILIGDTGYGSSPQL